MTTATPAPLVLCGNDDDPTDHSLCRCCGALPLVHPTDAVCPVCEAEYPGYSAPPQAAAEVTP